jgi:ankyrin repeat protein
VIALFLSHGLQVDTTDHEVTEWTSLHHACCAGQTRVVEFLLERKASANARNKQDETPLHLAFGNGNMEIIRLLMQADPPAQMSKDAIGFTPLQYATIELAARMDVCEHNCIRSQCTQGCESSISPEHTEDKAREAVRGASYSRCFVS